MNKKYLFVIKVVGWINEIISENSRKHVISIFESLAAKQLPNDKRINIVIPKNIEFEYEIWGKNYGKMKLLREINIMYPKYRKHNYVLYSDHDISHIPGQDIMKDRSLIGTEINGKLICAVSFTQIPDNRHNQIVYTNEVSFDDRVFYYSNNNIHVASGCFLFEPKSNFLSILKDLRDDISIYGTEDIAFGEQLNKKYIINIVSPFQVNHPFDNDHEYATWKRNTILYMSGLIKEKPSNNPPFII